jgi:hypothetical protein
MFTHTFEMSMLKVSSKKIVLDGEKTASSTKTAGKID